MEPYKKEYERLLLLFRQLDRMYQVHTSEHPFGLLDCPFSLISNTRNTIDDAIGIERNVYDETFKKSLKEQSWVKQLGFTPSEIK